MQGHYETIIADTSKILADSILAQEDGLEARALKVDVDVKELLRQIGLAMMTQIFGTLSARVSSAVEAQGIKANRRSHVRFSVVFGEVLVPSPYHWDRVTRRSARPVQDQLGLSSRGRSLGVERALTDFGAEESFGQAANRFHEHYGWEVGRTTVLRVVEGQAVQAEKYVAQRLEEAEQTYHQPIATRPGTQQMLVEFDGCEIRTGRLVKAPGRGRTPVRRQLRRRRIEAWRDVRVGLAGPLDAPDERTYVAKVDTYPQVVRQLFAAACEQGLSSQTQVIAVADGGNGLREELDAQFPGLQFILDRPHLKQHFYQAADAQGLAGEPREQWVSKHLETIGAGGASEVLRQLARHKGRGKTRIKRLVKYLTRFGDAVHYERYRREGFPLGSGEIESCHRWLPQKRLKLPGAWWNLPTLNAMLALRVLRANGWWDDYWAMKHPERAA